MKSSIAHRFGLSRVDLAVAFVLVVVGVASVWSVSQSRRDSAATLEAANFLREVHRCQHEYRGAHHRFATSIAELDLRLPPPTAFDLRLTNPSDDQWTLMAIRQGVSVVTDVSNPSGRLSINQDGWFADRGRSSTRRGTTPVAMARPSRHPSIRHPSLGP